MLEGFVLVIYMVFLCCFSLCVILLYLFEVLGGSRAAQGAFGGRSGGGEVRDSLVQGLSARHLGGSLGPSGALKGARDLLWFSCSGVLGRPGRRFNGIFIKSAETYKAQQEHNFGKTKWQ